MGSVARNLLRRAYLFLRMLLFFLPSLLVRKRPAPMPEAVQSILVLRHDRIGDMVLSTPCFKALKQRYPAARLTVVASSTNAEVLRHNPFVDEVFVYQGLGVFFRQMRQRSFDLAVDLFYTYELRTAFLAYLSGASYRIGFEEAGREIFFNVRGPKMRSKRRMTELMMRIIACLGGAPTEGSPEVYLSAEETAWAKGVFASTNIEKKIKIAVHPGGYYPSQRWPVEKFIEVARRLLEKYPLHFLVFANKDEEEILRAFEKAMPAGTASFFSALTLRQFAALLSGCRLALCNNSGALHLASALDVPTVSTMGPTDPVLWQPEGERHIVLRVEGARCGFCGLGLCSGHASLDLISVDDMTAAARRQLGRQAI